MILVPNNHERVFTIEEEDMSNMVIHETSNFRVSRNDGNIHGNAMRSGVDFHRIN